MIILAYHFSNQQKAKAYIQEMGRKYNLAGINGEQTNANNFQTALMGLLHVVGKDTDAIGTGRTISQDVEEDSP